MKIIATLLAATCACASGQIVYETNITVQVVAGSQFSGYIDGQGTQTMFVSPVGLCSDTSSNIYAGDSGNRSLRKVSPQGQVTTVLGSSNGFSASLTSLAFDGTRYVWGIGDQTLYRFEVAAGGFGSFSIPGVGYYSKLACNAAGEVFISSEFDNRIYRFRNGSVEVFVGSGNGGYADGTGLFTAFQGPADIAFDAADNLYVADRGNYVVRKVSPQGVVTTLAGKRQQQGHVDAKGTNALFQWITGLAVNRAGEVFVAGSYQIRKISPDGNVTTAAGADESGYIEGDARTARFLGIASLALGADGAIYMGDATRVRKLSAPHEEIIDAGALSLRLFAGITLSGIPGRTYRIDGAGSLSSTNWTEIQKIMLPSSPFLWIDTNAATRNAKFFRTVLLP